MISIRSYFARPLAAIVVLEILAAASFAATASVSLSPNLGPPTTRTTATGSGFSSGESVTLTFDTATLGHATADSSGNFSLGVTVAKSAQPGSHAVQATGKTSGLTASTKFLVRTDWTSFKDSPTHLGFNALENTISKNNATSLTLAWQGQMGDLVDFSSPAVVNGIVYVGSFDGKLYAFNANGCAPATVCQPLWSGATGNDITSSPAVTNGTVFIGSADHKLYAFAAKGCGKSTCPPLWKGATGGAILDSSPVVVNGVVYVGDFDNKLYAFKAAGCGAAVCSPLWTGATGDHITSSPAVDNGVVYIGSQDGNLYAFTAAGCGAGTCSPLWTARAGSSIVDSSPVISGGVAYIGSFDGGLFAFNSAGCSQSTCQPLWTGSTGPFISSSPSVANGCGLCGRRRFHFLRLPSGGMWRFYLPPSLDRRCRGRASRHHFVSNGGERIGLCRREQRHGDGLQRQRMRHRVLPSDHSTAGQQRADRFVVTNRRERHSLRRIGRSKPGTYRPAVRLQTLALKMLM